MQTRNPILDDLSKVMAGAAGHAQAANDEVKTLFRSQSERFVAEMDLARRDEVEALKTLPGRPLKRPRLFGETRRGARSQAGRDKFAAEFGKEGLSP